MKLLCIVLALLYLDARPLLAQDPQQPGVVSAAEGSPAPAQTYSPSSDAARDIQEALLKARHTGKRVLLDVGGDWCPWCRALDQLFAGSPALVQLRDDNFITVRVYYNSGQTNEQALSRYSKVLGIPHCFVLDSSGALLQSQHMVELQTNGRYDAAKVKAFLTRWSVPVTGP